MSTDKDHVYLLPPNLFMNFDALKYMVKALERFLGARSARKDKRQAEERLAIQAFLRAIHETQLYLGSGPRKLNDWTPTQNRKLSKAWLVASEKVRVLDPDLAERCFLKGDFWADPSEWSTEDLRRARILLSQVENDARDILGKSES